MLQMFHIGSVRLGTRNTPNIIKVLKFTKKTESESNGATPNVNTKIRRGGFKHKLVEKYYMDKHLFGQLIKVKKKKGKETENSENETVSESVHNVADSELKWMLKTSKHITILNSLSQKRSQKRFKGTRSKRKKSNEKIANVPEDSSLTVKDLISFPIFCSKDLEISTNLEGINYAVGISSVTHILQDTMPLESQLALQQWKLGMIKKLGLEEFNIYSKELLETGRLLHSCIENTLLQKEFETPSKIELLYSSVKPVLSYVGNVEGLESRVAHPHLRYKGIVDCIASYRDKLCVIDWKRSEKRKPTIALTYDAPLQIAAYIGAVNASANYPFKIDRGVIVVAYTDGGPADVHEIEIKKLQKWWQKWLKRLQQFHNKANESGKQDIDSDDE